MELLQPKYEKSIIFFTIIKNKFLFKGKKVSLNKNLLKIKYIISTHVRLPASA